MKQIKLLSLIVIALLLFSCTQEKKISDEKKAAIDELILISDLENQWKNIIHAEIVSQKELLKKNIDAKKGNKFSHAQIDEHFELVEMYYYQKIAKKGYMEEIYSIYDKYLTIDEIKRVIEFYKTPVGRLETYVNEKFTNDLAIALFTIFKDNSEQIERIVEERLAKEGFNPDYSLK